MMIPDGRIIISYLKGVNINVYCGNVYKVWGVVRFVDTVKAYIVP